jgi:hypothetical protein
LPVLRRSPVVFQCQRWEPRSIVPSSGRNHQRGIMLHQPLPVLNCRNITSPSLELFGMCLPKCSLDLRPPGRSRTAEPTREIRTEKSTFVYDMSSKGKEIEKKMRKAAACHDPPFLCERIVPFPKSRRKGRNMTIVRVDKKIQSPDHINRACKPCQP